MKVYVIIVVSMLASYIQTKEEQPQQAAHQPQVIQQVQKQKPQEEEADFGIPMLATFLTQIIPGIAKTIVGSKKNAPELAIEGTQQFSTGIVTFLSLIPARNGSSDLAALSDPVVITTYLEKHKNDPAIKECIALLAQLQEALN